MVQTVVTTEWLLEGFKYELGATRNSKTVTYYFGHLYRFLKWANRNDIPKEAHRIEKRHIEAFFYYLLKESETVIGGNGARRKVTRTDRSLWPYFRSLRRFFSWAIVEGYLEQNPMGSIKIKRPAIRPVEPWRSEHIKRLFMVIDHDEKTAHTHRQKMLAARDRAVVSLFLDSFIRLQELAQLDIDDLDLGSQRLFVRKGKMDKGRWAGFGPTTRKYLWQYLCLRQEITGTTSLWVSEEGRTLSWRGIQEIFRRLKRESGLSHVKGSIHKMRHTGATIHYKHNRDMKGLKNLLGHSTYAMTDRYTAYVEVEDSLEKYKGGGPVEWVYEKK